MRRTPVVLVAALLVAPPPVAHAGPIVSVYAVPAVFTFDDESPAFIVIRCVAEASVAGTEKIPAVTSSFCAINGDPDAWITEGTRDVVRTSPTSFSGRMAVSMWMGSVTFPVTLCAGGSAVYNERMNRVFVVQATPVCYELTR